MPFSFHYLPTGFSPLMPTMYSTTWPVMAHLASKLGQIGPKWDKSGTFSDQISGHFGATQEVPDSNLVRTYGSFRTSLPHDLYIVYGQTMTILFLLIWIFIDLLSPMCPALFTLSKLRDLTEISVVEVYLPPCLWPIEKHGFFILVKFFSNFTRCWYLLNEIVRRWHKLYIKKKVWWKTAIFQIWF